MEFIVNCYNKIEITIQSQDNFHKNANKVLNSY